MIIATYGDEKDNGVDVVRYEGAPQTSRNHVCCYYEWYEEACSVDICAVSIQPLDS